MAFRGMKNLSIDSITKITDGDLYMPEIANGTVGTGISLEEEFISLFCQLTL